ncbi:MAG: tRNA (adenosine(37)-N6)-threonylcarbamoyltransferase complex transferase subunit TsaD [Cyanobacteria bacterium J06641_5]
MGCVLAIETSCDETAAAIVCDRRVCSSIVRSQIDLHRPYGGVVPEMASRAHLETVNAVIELAFAKAGLGWDDIDAIATTVAPGLVGALLVGATVGKTLALVRNKPFLGVHHLEGHVYASFLAEPQLEPPFLCLLVSGGHTSLLAVRSCGNYTLLGATHDDAAGEAFDKVARLLGLGYPGGPAIDRLAQTGDPTAFKLPEGRVSRPEGGYYPYDFSFSGLKTAVGRLVEQLQLGPDAVEELPIADLAASFQDTVARVLAKRTVACAQAHQLPAIVVGGGVAANSGLRSHLQAAAAERDLPVYFPPLSLCTDNAAMIGCAAVAHLKQGHVSPLTLGVRSRLPIAQVMELYPATSGNQPRHSSSLPAEATVASDK